MRDVSRVSAQYISHPTVKKWPVDNCRCEHHKRIIVRGTVLGVPDIFVPAKISGDQPGLPIGMSKPAVDKVPAVNKPFIGETSVLYGLPEGVFVNFGRLSDAVSCQPFQLGQVFLINAARGSIVLLTK